MIHAGSAISPNINVKGFSVERKIFVQCDFVNSNNKREEITFILNQGGDGAWRLEKKELQSGLTGNFYVAFADNGKN